MAGANLFMAIPATTRLRLQHRGSRAVGQAARRARGVKLPLTAVRIRLGGPHQNQTTARAAGQSRGNLAMAVSLYDLSVPTYLQTLGAVSGFLEKGLAHCKECNTEPGEVVEHRLFQDMAPFSFQIRSEEHTSNSSHVEISYAVFCLKKKKNKNI